MIYIILIFLLALYISRADETNNQVTIDGYKTIYFSPESKKLFDILPSNHSKKDFAIMEDLFNKYEKLTVCNGMSHLKLALELDHQMKERFRGWDLSYHQRVLNQISQPSKVIDPNLKC